MKKFSLAFEDTDTGDKRVFEFQSEAISGVLSRFRLFLISILYMNQTDTLVSIDDPQMVADLYKLAMERKEKIKDISKNANSREGFPPRPEDIN